MKKKLEMRDMKSHCEKQSCNNEKVTITRKSCNKKIKKKKKITNVSCNNEKQVAITRKNCKCKI